MASLQNPIPPNQPQDYQRGPGGNSDTSRPRLADVDVWHFVTEGCNAAEIAAYAGVSIAVAQSWIYRARHKAANPGRFPSMRGEARAEG